MNFISAQLPENEERRAQAVEITGLIDSNQASLFNIYCELAKDITGYEAVLFQLLTVRTLLGKLVYRRKNKKPKYSSTKRWKRLCSCFTRDQTFTCF